MNEEDAEIRLRWLGDSLWGFLGSIWKIEKKKEIFLGLYISWRQIILIQNLFSIMNEEKQQGAKYK